MVQIDQNFPILGISVIRLCVKVLSPAPCSRKQGGESCDLRLLEACSLINLGASLREGRMLG
jgi:hypothetical protein